MKLTQSKIKGIILDILGEEGLKLVKELRNKENISEFSLATKLRKDIKIIRRMLYKLSDYNLVSSNRKKDKQKGWYIYYWTLVPENIKFLYLKNKKELLQKLREQVVKEQTEQFFTCVKKCVRLDFDQAMDFEFRCPECGELISQDQDSEGIERLQKKIVFLEKEIKLGEKEGKRVQKVIEKKIIEKKEVKMKKKVKKKKPVKKKPKKKKKVGLLIKKKVKLLKKRERKVSKKRERKKMIKRKNKKLNGESVKKEGKKK